MRVTVQHRTGTFPPAEYDAIAVHEHDDMQFDLKIERRDEQPLLVNSDFYRLVIGATDA